MFEVKRLDHVALTVRDLERSIAWYRDVLGLERRHQETWGDYPVMMYAGETAVALFHSSGKVSAAPDCRGAAIMRHFAFQVDRAGFAAARDELRARGVDFEFQDHTLSHSIYLQDPDGYQVELTTYDIAG
ncbi:MAG TPA: VOC family protein [Bryobacteraceae bacterium]|nr:VOC family protein [Bryobacteraceae bacterium]